jgi:asparagine synthase (glutamine-hydrolysing)
MAKIRARGPDATQVISNDCVTMGFARLAINGTDDDSMQPFSDSNVSLMCNAEVFNHKNLERDLNYTPKSGSDCEVLVEGYKRWMLPGLCGRMDAEFAMIVHDIESKVLWVARDPYGVRPLFWGTTKNGSYVFSSELKGLAQMCVTSQQFNPGWFMGIKLNRNPDMFQYSSYTALTLGPRLIMDQTDAAGRVATLLEEAVKKRLMCQNGGVCCLLSGGLDSSLVAALAQKNSKMPISTYSIGMEGSPDLEYAKKVAEHIGSIHTTVCYPKEEFLDAIPDVVRATESYDVTTVRASVGNYLVGKFIRNFSTFKVVLNGDYADEVCGGYLYMKLAPSDEEFEKECRRLVGDIHYFDSLRSDRTICAHGLEARAPFADKQFVEFYLKLARSVTSPEDKMEKYLLRKAFDGTDLLPQEVLWRSKEAFSDGVSQQGKSWHTMASEYAQKMGFTNEAEYYKHIFEDAYDSRHSNVIPYKWMPKWCDATDPSARTLKIYNVSK